MWESGVSFQSTCVLATAATSRANPGWSGKDETVQAEESGKEGKMRESEKIDSRGSSDDDDALRLPRPKKETAIAESDSCPLRSKFSESVGVKMAMERARRIKWICLRLSVCRRLAGYGDGGDDLFLYTFAERRKGRKEAKDLDASRRVVEWSGCF